MSLRNLVYASPLYRLALIGKTPKRLLFTPPDLWPGDARRGEAIVKGNFILAGRDRRFDDFATPMAAAGNGWLAELHGFSWLRHLRAVGSTSARRRAGGLCEGWINANSGWHSLSWRPDVMAERLVNWFTHFDFIAGDDAPFRHRLLSCLASQSRHLARATGAMNGGARTLRSLKGLVFSGICLPGHRPVGDKALNILERETARQILPDGGHMERSPFLQMTVLGDFVDLRAALGAAHWEVPGWMQGAIDRMAPMLRGFRHGDGKLALFNGTWEGDREAIDALLAQAEVKGRPLSNAPHSGFHRLAAGRTLVIADCGSPVPCRDSPHAHAGTLSFEMSIAKKRLIVNCGSHPGEEGDLFMALRSTAAHSTAVVADTNSSDVIPAGGIGRRAAGVSCHRREADGDIYLEASHDGYRRTFSLIHKRCLFLTSRGEDFRGEDILSGPGGQAFAVRFHLHPRVRASQIKDGSAILLRLPGGAGWRFRAAGGTLTLEESIYLGAGGEAKRSAQMVVSGLLGDGGATVKWSLRREKDSR